MDAHHEINRRKTVVKRIIIMALGVLLALALATPMALAQVGQGANKSLSAKEFQELAAAWTQWAYSKEPAESPLIGGDPDYTEAQCDGTPVSPTPGKTWFLAGTPDGSMVERTCTMPAGTQLFFPVVSASFFITFPGPPFFEDKQLARDSVRDFIKAVEHDPELSIEVTVDGEEIDSKQIVRAKTPRFFPVTFPEDNIFDCPQCPTPFDLPGGTYDTVSNGLWVALPPLTPGEHVIHFELSAPNADVFPTNPGIEGFSQDNTYILTVG
jgi:hypothetical protein